MLNDSGGGPWGGRGSGGGSGGSGGGDGNGGGPRNPWNLPPDGGRPRGPRPGNGTTALDQLLRRSRARFGGNMPDFGGRPIWAYALFTFFAIWILLTSIHRIAPSERGVVLRLGRYAGTMGPGLNLSLPAPIDQVVTQNVEERTLDIGSTSSEASNLLLTRDENLVNFAYSVRWNVADPAQYLFQVAEPESAIRDAADSAMRAAVNGLTLAQIDANRAGIEQRAAARTQALLNAYHSGIRIGGVTIRRAEAPLEVAEASKKVAAAQQKVLGYLDEARTYAQQQTAKAQGEATAFDKVYAQYKLSPEVTRRRMYYDMMEDVLSKVDKTIVDAPGVNASLPLPQGRHARAGEEQGQ